MAKNPVLPGNESRMNEYRSVISIFVIVNVTFLMLKNLAEPVEGATSLMIDTQKLPARLAESEKKERMTSRRDCLFIPKASVTGMNAVDNLPAEAQIIIARFLLPAALKIEGAIS